MLRTYLEAGLDPFNLLLVRVCIGPEVLRPYFEAGLCSFDLMFRRVCREAEPLCREPEGVPRKT